MTSLRSPFAFTSGGGERRGVYLWQVRLDVGPEVLARHVGGPRGDLLLVGDEQLAGRVGVALGIVVDPTLLRGRYVRVVARLRQSNSSSQQHQRGRNCRANKIITRLIFSPFMSSHVTAAFLAARGSRVVLPEPMTLDELVSQRFPSMPRRIAGGP